MAHALTKQLSVAGLLLMLAFSGQALAGDAPIASGEMLAGTCAGCHGTDGASPGPIPPLRGYPADAMATAMRMFRSGQRPSTVMGRIARGYNDAEIQAMAAFFANTK